MPVSTATVTTLSPAQFTSRLVAHLAHQAAVELAADGRATITSGQGTCVLTPSREGLSVTAAAADPGQLAAVQDFLTGHLRQLADEDLNVHWAAPATGADLQITDPVIEDYVLRHCTAADSLLADLTLTTRRATGGSATMQVSADEGAFLTMLTRLARARFAVEVGVFTGYSSICIARGLAEGGRLLACDTSQDWTDIARGFWQRAGLAGRIDLKIGPAIDTLRALPVEPHIDIAFIDADKASYPAYYQQIVTRLRPGGLVLLDNVLLGGRVADPAYTEEHHETMRQLNDLIAADDRVDAVMLPMRDGLTLARKR